MMRAPLMEEAKREIDTSNRVASSTKADVNKGPTAMTLATVSASGDTSDGTTSENKGQGEGLFLPPRPVERINRRIRRLLLAYLLRGKYLRNKDYPPSLIMFQSPLINPLICFDIGSQSTVLTQQTRSRNMFQIFIRQYPQTHLDPKNSTCKCKEPICGAPSPPTSTLYPPSGDPDVEKHTTFRRLHFSLIFRVPCPGTLRGLSDKEDVVYES